MTTFEDDRLSDDIAAQHQREQEVCACGHPLYRHHVLGACMVLGEKMVGGVLYQSGAYCPCLDGQAAQP